MLWRIGRKVVILKMVLSSRRITKQGRTTTQSKINIQTTKRYYAQPFIERKRRKEKRHDVELELPLTHYWSRGLYLFSTQECNICSSTSSWAQWDLSIWWWYLATSSNPLCLSLLLVYKTYNIFLDSYRSKHGKSNGTSQLKQR